MPANPEQRRQQQQLEFLARLRKAVRASGMTQKELARRLGVAESSVTGWLRSGALPGADVLFELPYVLNTSADWLLAERGSGKPPAQGTGPDPAYMEGGLAVLGEVELALRKVQDRWAGKVQHTTKAHASPQRRKAARPTNESYQVPPGRRPNARRQTGARA